jgi:type I restriction enzyme M protein
MKEFKFEDMMPVQALEQKVWKMFDILRSESIATEEYHIILFLLSLYKDGFISEDVLESKDDIHHIIIIGIKEHDNLIAQQYLAIQQSFKNTLDHLDEKVFYSLIQEIFGLDKEILSDNFSDIFDSVLYRITQSKNQNIGLSNQPVELTRFICSLADLPEKSKIFDPFAGLASFGVCFDEGQDYLGQEINQKAWAIGVLRLMAYERPGISKFECKDSILNWPSQDEKFDLVVANPPLGMRLNKQYPELDLGGRTIEHFFIEKGLKSLAPKGKIIALVPQRFLFEGNQEKQLRKHLIERDVIDTIISLPGGLLPHTSIPLTVLVINNNKNTPGKVRFIDANKFVESKSPKEKVLNDYKLNGVVNTVEGNSEVVRMIDNDLIKEQDYNLQTLRYFQSNVEGVKLGAILDEIKPSKSESKPYNLIFKRHHLKDNPIDYKLNINSQVDDPLKSGVVSQLIESSGLNKSIPRLISESCLLVSLNGRDLKPTYFEFQGIPIQVDHRIYCFKINEKLVDVNYLINEFYKEYVSEQLISFRKGTALPIISKKDFLDVSIKLPLLDEQYKIVHDERVEFFNTRFRDLEKFKKGLGLEVADANSFLRHQVAGPLKNLREAFSSVSKILSAEIVSKHPEILDSKVHPKRTQTFGDYLNNMERDLMKVSRLVMDSNKEFNLNKAELTEVKLLKLVRNFVDEIKDREPSIEVALFYDKELMEDENIEDVVIEGNEELIIDALENLVENAIKHGLEGYEGRKLIHFQLHFDLEADEIQLDVANSGHRISEDFMVHHFTRQGSKTGTNAGDGFGGWYINEIMKKHKGRVSLTDEQGPEGAFGDLAVSFELYFPIKEFVKK